jgi:hypothetical protein
MRLTRRGLGVAAAAVAVACFPTLSTPAGALSAAGPPAAVHHVFVINLENKGYDETFGPTSPATYLSGQLRAEGQLLTQYYGVAHNSLPNYLAQVSGQGPNVATQADCPVYSAFASAGSTVAPGQAIGQGCVYPSSVRTVADQLEAKGLTWKGYLEDMGTPCRHPALNSADDTQQAEVGDQYAARHNPFVYFTSITSSPSCAQNDVDLTRLPKDLASMGTTANLTYLTPNLCNDARDSPCVDGRIGGLASADVWLHTWVPKILASPAYKKDGLLVITFDEADTANPDGAAACCGEGPGPNSPLPGIYGLGGGRTGSLLVSRFIAAGSFNNTAYNHYSLLRTIEDLFGLPALGYANNARGFGLEVFGQTR